MNVIYEDIVKSYEDNLENNLRGFRAGPGFLDSFVPSGEEPKDLEELYQLAESSDEDIVRIYAKDSLYAVYLSPKATVIQHALQELSQVIMLLIANIIGNRLVVSYDRKEHPLLHRSLINIERRLNESLGTNYRLEVEELSDKNKRKKY